MESKAHFVDSLFESLIFFLDLLVLVLPLKNLLVFLLDGDIQGVNGLVECENLHLRIRNGLANLMVVCGDLFKISKLILVRLKTELKFLKLFLEVLVFTGEILRIFMVMFEFSFQLCNLLIKSLDYLFGMLELILKTQSLIQFNAEFLNFRLLLLKVSVGLFDFR